MAENKKALDDSELDIINGGRILSVSGEERMNFAGKFVSSLLRRNIPLEEGLAILRNNNNTMVGDRKMTEEDLEQISSLIKDKFKGQL